MLSLSGVKTVIWLEGNNDFSRNGNASMEAVRDRLIKGVARTRAAIPGVRVIGTTLSSALSSTRDTHGFLEHDEKRRALNYFIRTADIFDAWGFERCRWGTDRTRTYAVVNYDQAVERFRVTDRLTDSERPMLMGGACAKAYRWEPKKG